MGKESGITWTRSTWNPWRGCQRVSEGCRHCYAATGSARNPLVLGEWGPEVTGGTRIVASENGPNGWAAPLRWNDEAGRRGWPWPVFPSWCDPFEQWGGHMRHHKGDVLHECGECGTWKTMAEMCHGPLAHNALTMDDVRCRLFRLIERTPNLTWLLLTKRPENVRAMVPNAWAAGGWPANVWLGVSVEDEGTALKRFPHFVDIPARLRFVSYEPALGPVTFGPWLPHLHWIIVGGESGAEARSFGVKWALDTLRECKAADVPVFVKQLGKSPYVESTSQGMQGQRFPLVVTDKKGADPEEWPDQLRVQQMPKGHDLTRLAL